MLNRRMVLAGLPVFLAACAGEPGDIPPRRTQDVWGAGEEVPSAKVIRGHPNVLDFGDGLKIPFNQYAFLTLWEGKTFWLTYGAGRAPRSYQADGMAMRAAEGTMKLLLMTLAFAPERLEHADGGWRLKQQNMGNYVRGLLELPGKPFAPQTDASLGFGNMDTAYASAEMSMASLGQTSNMPGSSGGAVLPVDILGDHKVDSFTCFILKKKDVDLDTVRKIAQIDTLTPTGGKAGANVGSGSGPK